MKSLRLRHIGANSSYKTYCDVLVFLACFILLILPLKSNAQIPISEINKEKFTIENCVSEFDLSEIDSTKVGYQYWFVDKQFLDGRTLKVSVVEPFKATHEPHTHAEDEFFFILEGRAIFYLEDESDTVEAYSSLYCPPNLLHGIRNAGDTELKYLVIKKYILNK